MGLNRGNLLVLGLFLLMPWLFFASAIAAGSLLGPSDGLAYYLPTRVLAARAWLGGEVPFWNPYNFSGMPLLATLQGGVFFPGNWPFLVLPPIPAFNLAVTQAFSVAGLGTYAFCRAIGASRAGAIAAGLTFMFSGFMVGHVIHLTVLQAAGLIPVMLWGLERYARTLRPRYAILGSLTLAAAVLAGHPQTLAYGMLAVGAFGLWRAVTLPGPQRVPFLLGLLAGGVLAVGVAFIQLAPTLEFIPRTQRSALSYQQLLDFSLPPRQLATLLFPYLFGATGSWLYPVSYWGAGNHAAEGMAYLGLAGLTLALVAVFRIRQDVQVRFWLLTALVAAALACGDATPLFKLTTLVPPYNAMRVPGRHLLEMHLALAVLAGLGLTWLQAQSPGLRRGLIGAGVLVGGALAAGALLLAFFGRALAARLQPYFTLDLTAALSISQPAVWVPLLTGLGLVVPLVLLVKRPRDLGPAAIVGFIAIDLGFVGQHMDWNTLRPAPPVVPAYDMSAFPSEGRIVSPTPRFGYFHPAVIRDLALPGPAGIAGIRSASGYDAFILSRYSQAFGGITSGVGKWTPHVFQPSSHVLDVLSVRQIRLDRLYQEKPAWAAALRQADAPLERRLEQAYVYANPDALPIAWRPNAAQVHPAAEVDRRMRGEAPFDPRTEVLLEEGQAPSMSAGTADARPVSFNRIAVETQGEGPGMVVVSESYDPGWRAFMGERELAVRRADALVLGIEVPPGAIAFELRYEPPAWRTGLLVSALSVLGLLGWAGWSRRRAKIAAAVMP